MKMRLIPLILIVAFSCSAPSVKEEIKPVIEQVKKIEQPADTNISTLEKFFKRSESDTSRAGAVIQRHNIIQQLTHLKLMDKGGKKFYLLERENITEMINSVTEGIYLDYILINKYGEIIYTKSNDSIFGTNVNEGYVETPLKKCFSNKGEIYFEDVALITPSSKTYSLYVSSPVYVQNSFHGILVMQIDISKIHELLERETDVINREGLIKVTSDRARINSIISNYTNFNINEIEKKGSMSILASGEEIDLRAFNFKSISWILVKKKA